MVFLLSKQGDAVCRPADSLVESDPGPLSEKLVSPQEMGISFDRNHDREGKR
jgi:hypothetical protein